jgi:hypothetical protein
MRPDNPPAFPRPGYYPPTSRDDDIEHLREMLPTVTEPQDGLTLRDYFAAVALQGILAGAGEDQPEARVLDYVYDVRSDMELTDYTRQLRVSSTRRIAANRVRIADTAYMMADAMLTARSQKPESKE